MYVPASGRMEFEWMCVWVFYCLPKLNRFFFRIRDVHKCRIPWAGIFFAGARTRKSPSFSIHLFVSTNLFESGAAVFVLYMPECECATVESTVLWTLNSEHIVESECKKKMCIHTQHTRHVRGDTMSERSNDVSTFIVTTTSVHIIKIISVCYSPISLGCVRVLIFFLWLRIHPLEWLAFSKQINILKLFKWIWYESTPPITYHMVVMWIVEHSSDRVERLAADFRSTI